MCILFPLYIDKVLLKTPYYVKIIYIKRYNVMGYKYIRDISTEYPFYQRMAGLLKGKKSSRSIGGKEIYEVECPCCKKRRSYMFMSEKGDTFIFKCFLPQCSITSVPLHDLIKRYGGQMFNEWREASWTTTYEENWFPIKNKVPYKDRRPPRKKTFQEKQELKSLALKIKVECEDPNLGPTHPHPHPRQSP